MLSWRCITARMLLELNVTRRIHLYDDGLMYRTAILDTGHQTGIYSYIGIKKWILTFTHGILLCLWCLCENSSLYVIQPYAIFLYINDRTVSAQM